MSKSELAWRSLHDLGLATWFGGSIFGSFAPPPTTAAPSAYTAADTAQKVEGESWRRFSPVLTAAITAHLVGGAGLIAWNRGRHANQAGVLTTTIVKSAITVAALGLTVGAAVQGAKADRLRRQSEDGDSSPELVGQRERLDRQMRLLTPLIPATTGALVVLGALEGEEQRPREMARGLITSAGRTVRDALPDPVLQALPGAA